MKRINPLFDEDEHPLDALNSVCSILGFLRDFNTNSSRDISLSNQSAGGFIYLIMMLEETVRQIYEELQERDREKAGKA